MVSSSIQRQRQRSRPSVSSRKYDTLRLFFKLYCVKYSVRWQACEAQEQCCEAAQDLVDQLDIFLSVFGEEAILQQGKRTREAQNHMLILLARATDYIRNRTRTGAFGA